MGPSPLPLPCSGGAPGSLPVQKCAMAPESRCPRAGLKSTALCPHRYAHACQTEALGLGLEKEVPGGPGCRLCPPQSRLLFRPQGCKGILCVRNASREGCWRQPPSPGLVPDHRGLAAPGCRSGDEGTLGGCQQADPHSHPKASPLGLAQTCSERLS